MIGTSERLGVRRGEVAAKVIDGEAILINLTTGLYYSMGRVGGRIWSLVERNHTAEEIGAAIAAEYGVASATVRADVEKLVEQLAAERLVEVQPAGAAEPAAPVIAAQTAPYTTPELRKFSDMAEIFAMDPPLPGLSKGGA